MSREAQAREIAKRDEDMAVMPELVFFQELDDGSSSMLEYLETNPNTTFQGVYPRVKRLKRPLGVLFDEYEFKHELNQKQFDELLDTGLSAMDIAYHFLYQKKKQDDQQWTDLVSEVLDYINENPQEFGRRSQLNNIAQDTVDEFGAQYEKRLALFLSKLQAAQQEQNEFQGLETLPVVGTQVLKSFFVFKCETGKDVLEYFNEAEVSHTIPYITLAPYIKMTQTTKVYPEWNTANQDALIGYVRVGASENLRAYSQFELTDTTLTIESKQEEKYSDEPVQDIIERVQAAIPSASKGDKVSEELSVETFIANVDMVAPLFRYFVTTDPVVRKFFFIDDSLQTERKREFLTLYYYETPDSAPVVLSIGNRRAKEKALPDLPSGRCHIRIYVKRCTREKLDKALADVTRCVRRYQMQKANFVGSLLAIDNTLDEEYKQHCVAGRQAAEQLNYTTFYRDLNVSLRSIQPPSRPRLVPLDKINPETHYVINPEEDGLENVLDADEAENRLLIFPKKRDEKALQRYGYTCDQVQNKENGLVNVNLRNYQQLQTLRKIPVCVSEDSYHNKQSEMNLYLSDEEKEAAATSYVITTSGILSKNQFGRMTDPVDKWYQFVDTDKTLYRRGLFNYFRGGDVVPTELRHASILLLLETLVEDNTDDYESMVLTAKEKVKRTLDEKNAYRTETYAYKENDLKELLDRGEFIDPRLFYYVLRDTYEVELILFTKDEAKNKTPFYPCPLVMHTPLMSEPKYNRFLCVCINPGGEFDALPFPVCEPIFAAVSPPSRRQYEPQYMNVVIDNALYKAWQEVMKDVYGIAFRQYNLSDNVTEQTLDAFGRVRWLHVAMGQNETLHIQLLTPIHSQNFPLRQEEDYVFENQTQTRVERFLRGTPTDEATQTFDTMGRLTGYTVIKGDMRYFIPILIRRQLDEQGYQDSYDLTYDDYQIHEKAARYLTEYTYLAYSIFAKGQDDFDERVRLFFNDGFVIRPNHEYTADISRKWTERHPKYLDDGGRVIVRSDLIKKKLMYLLRQKYHANRELLLMYYRLDYMPNYYASLTDFQRQPNTLLLDRQLQQPISQESGSRVVKDTNSPYMLYHTIEELNHDVWLCQPATSLEHALWICEQWRKEKTNPAESDELDEDTTPHIKLIWSSETTYTIEGEDASRVVSILPLETGPVYQALLPYRPM